MPNPITCDSCVLTKDIRSIIQATEVKYLRRIKGITRRDRVRNEVVRQELKVEPILKKIHKQQLKWFSHLMTINNSRPVMKIFQDDREEERRTPEENMGKFNSGHFKRKKYYVE